MELFVFNVQSVSEVITNSSSELFVFEGNTENEVISILDSIYPNWRDEYDDPKKVADFSKEEIEDYLYNINVLDSWIWDDSKFLEMKKNESFRCCDLAKELGLSMTEAFDNWDDWDLTDRKNKSWEDRQLKLSDKFIEKFKESAEKENTYALYSYDDNPLWEYQELLMEVAERHHLG